MSPHLYWRISSWKSTDIVFHLANGTSAKLIQPVLAIADIDRLPCYLETMNEMNVPFYEKHGFRVVSDGVVPGHRLSVWAMLREPG
jgi:hypothetical protein